jgi:membrane fusion protein (multidrug efflux system)
MRSRHMILVLSVALMSVGAILLLFNPLKKWMIRVSGFGPRPPSISVQNHNDTPFSVKVTRARKGDLIIRAQSPGEALAERTLSMKAEVSGIIIRLLAREGMTAQKGDLLAMVDDRESRLKLERLEAQRLSALSAMLLDNPSTSLRAEREATHSVRLARAKEEFDKNESLFKDGVLSEADFEKAQKNYERILIEMGMKKNEIMAAAKGLTQSEADVQIVRMEMEKAAIRAPFPGIITGIKVVLGEQVRPGTELFTLVNRCQVKVLAKVLESEIGKIKAGSEAVLRFSSYPRQAFKGKVEAISPVINPEERTCEVLIALENPGQKIWPGMHAEAEITVDVFGGRLIVPQEALLERSGKKLVFVVENGLAKWRYIETGLENEEYVEILGGLKEGEIVVVEGHFSLAHDALVNPIWK